MKIPKSVLLKMDELMPEEEKQRFCGSPVEDLPNYNYGFGTMIRLKLLRANNGLYQRFIDKGCYDRDVMTMLLIEEYHRYLNIRS